VTGGEKSPSPRTSHENFTKIAEFIDILIKQKEGQNMPGTRKLGRPTAHRKAMLRGMVTLLLENGQVETTLTRAKEVRSIAEKMITLGKKNTLASRRAALAYITKEDVVTKLFAEIAPKYANRQGGYTQIFKIGARRGDAAEMAIVKLIDEDVQA
jgi:large subunit ribosomal protein L17